VDTKVTLKIGADTPSAASEALTRALSAVEVTCGNTAPAGFQLTFDAERYDPRYTKSDTTTQEEWPLLTDGSVAPFNRVQLLVEIGTGSPQPLIDGFITRIELNLREGEASPVLVATGEDVSVKMDLFEISAEYQELAPSAVVGQILGKYSSLVQADVTTPSGESTPADYVLQQNCTDRLYLKMLAAQAGYEFYVQPGSPKSTAYWGPPVANKSPAPQTQKELVAQMGKRTNVLALNFSYDALAPTLTYAQVLDLSKNPAEATPVAIGSATQKPNLSSGGAIPGTPSPSGLAQDPSSARGQAQKLAVRGSLANYPGYPVPEATAIAQGRTNLSVTEVVTVEGELDTDAYGAVLTAPGLVDVYGVGTQYGGTFAVREVVHSLKFQDQDWQYRQKFVLTRGGLGFKG
jgi:hypothetical protein